jgi:hypothetical protein
VSANQLCVLVLSAAFAIAPIPAAADDAAQPVDGDAGVSIAAGLASLVYTPAKVLYAMGGGVAAGMAYLASAGNEDVAAPILTPSVRGDYVVTPEHLRGEKPLEFFGREAGGSSHANAEPPAVSSGDGLDGATVETADDAGEAHATE